MSWSIAGPGTPIATQVAPNEWDPSYNINPAGFSTVTWNVVSSPIVSAGDYTFDWNYIGFHAFFNVRVFLNTSDGEVLVNTGPANCCTSPSAGFNYSGSYTFSGLQVGDTIGFSMGGSNFDSNNTLRGNLNLVQVLE